MDEIICECGCPPHRHAPKGGRHFTMTGTPVYCTCQLSYPTVLQFRIADLQTAAEGQALVAAALRSLLSDAMKALGWAMNVIENEVEATDRTEHDFATDTSARIKATLTRGEADKPATKGFSGKCICTGLDEFPFDPNPDCPRHGSL